MIYSNDHVDQLYMLITSDLYMQVDHQHVDHHSDLSVIYANRSPACINSDLPVIYNSGDHLHVINSGDLFACVILVIT